MRFDCARAVPGASGTLRTSICAVAAALAIALGGCSATTKVYNGTPVMMLTAEAAGDFSAYSVGLYTITLTRSDGYVVYAQATDQQVDLTRRTNLTELFSGAGVPQGTYKSMTISLDYSTPIIYLKGQTSAAKVVNSAGANPGVVNEKVTFAPNHPLVVSLNQSTPFAIDIDLAASNSINASTNTVTVKPFIVATVQPYENNPLRARGQIVISSPSAGNFTENLRPFDDTYYADGDVGALTVNATSSTYFNINGTTYTGTAGLTALGNLNPGITVTAYGTLGNLSTITPTLNATAVYAGTTVISPGNEALRGIVTARSGNTLTLHGAEYVCQEGICFSNASFTYYPTVTVTLGSGTIVSEDGVAASGLSPQSVSVGQQITALGIGTQNGSTLTSFSAAPGQIRMQPTDVWGTLVSGAMGSATVNVLEIGNYAPSVFNFAGTGVASSGDANPSSYALNTGSFDASTLSAGTLLEANGFVAPFGSAPPDFNAATVTNMANGPSTLIVEWTAGTTAPFSSAGSSGIVVNLGNTSITSAIMRTGPQTTQLSSLSSSPTIIPGCASGTCSGNSEYATGSATNGIQVYDSPSSFISGLSSTVNGSNKVFKLVAIGTYDSTTSTFYTQRMDVALE